MTDQPKPTLSEKMDKLVPFVGEDQERFERMIAQLRGMISNGVKLSDQQVVSLAKFAMIEGLDPLTGECYILTNKEGATMGLMAGIAGARRKAKEALRGGDYFLYFQEIKDLPPGVEIGYHVTLRDTESQANYVKRLGDFARLYKEIGLTPAEAIEQARQDAGNAPIWEAEGFFMASERSDYKDRLYNPREKARKRAEAAVLRKRFGLRFNIGDNGEAGLVETSVHGQVIEGEATWTTSEAPTGSQKTEQSTEDQILMELGYS